MIDNRQELEKLGIDLRRITTSGKTTCPECSRDRKKKKDTCLSVNITDGTYKCHNCDWKGRVFEKIVFERKVYVRPVFANRTSLSKKLIDWFFTRGITQQTLLDFKIAEGLEWMPGVQKEVNTTQFCYFRDNELINIKFRDARKNFKLHKDAELIFYNLDAIKEVTECVICEGEIDAMSWHQSGYAAVVSVPNGASKNQKLEYLDNCFNYFENKTKIYLSSDDDIPGRALRDELGRRLGFERCFKVDFEGLKDANDYLNAHGPEKLLIRLVEAKEFPIVGVLNVDDIWPDVMDIYRNGLPDGDRTGDDEFDEHLRFMGGEMTIVTGIPSHGKSILLEQLSLQLCINADWKFGVFSPETHPKAMFILRLIKKLIGKPATIRNISPSNMELMRDWLSSRFHIIYPEEQGFVLDIILEKARQLVFKYGIKGLILDPWNRIENSKPVGTNESTFTAEQLIKIVKFNQSNEVHTFLVAHPTKMSKTHDGFYEVPNLYSISGSAHFFNITQNGITVYRNTQTGLTEIHIQKVKWEHLGKKGIIEYRYINENTRFMPKFTKQSQISAGYLTEDNKSWVPEITDTEAPALPSPQLGLQIDWGKQQVDFAPPMEDIEPPF